MHRFGVRRPSISPANNAHRVTFVLIWLTLLGVLLASVPAASQDSPAIAMRAFGHVTEVRDSTHVVVNRGWAEGVRRGATDLVLYPMRPPGTPDAVSSYVRLARGRVTELEEHSANLELSLVVEAVRVGDSFTYVLHIPASLVDDVLLGLAVADIRLVSHDSRQPFFEMSGLLADESAAFRDSIIDRMVQDARTAAAAQSTVLTSRIDVGLFRGRTMSEALQETRRDQVLAFLEFVQAFPGGYAGRAFDFVSAYAQWISWGTPSGDLQLAARKAGRVIARGDAAARDGRFDDAETAYREALIVAPDSEPAKRQVQQVVAVRFLQSQLAKDPDDTAKRFALLKALDELRAIDRVIPELDRLDKSGYRPVEVMEMRARVAYQQQRYSDAAALYRALLEREQREADRADYAKIIKMLELLEARRNAPGSATPLLALAQMVEEGRDWGLAATWYEQALDVVSTAEEMRAASVGLQRVAAQRQIDAEAGTAGELLERHDLENARRRIALILASCDALGDARCAAHHLDRLAKAATAVSEYGVGAELARERVRRDPNDPTARFDLALVLYPRRLAEAELAVEAGLGLKPNSPDGLIIRLALRVASGEVADGRQDAEAVVAASPDLASPYHYLAVFATASGRYDEALRWATEAFKRAPEDERNQKTLDAAVRAARASAAIKDGRDPARNRLSLIRTLAQFWLYDAVQHEIPALAGTSEFREANWLLAADNQGFVPAAVALEAARRAAPQTVGRQRWLHLLEARVAAQEHPEDPDRRLALAQAEVGVGSFHPALAALADLVGRGDGRAAGVAELAWKGLRANNLDLRAQNAADNEQHDTAEAFYREARDLYLQAGAPVNAMRVGGPYSVELAATGKFKDAIRVIERVIADEETDGEPLAVFADELRLASYQAKVGTLDAHARAITQGRAACERIDLDTCRSVVLNNQARFSAAEGRFTEAIGEAREALRLAEVSGATSMIRGALGQLGRLTLTVGDLDRSFAIAEDLLARSLAGRDVLGEQQALLLMGDVTLRRGDAQGARGYYAEVYKLGQRTGDATYRAAALSAEAGVQLDVAHRSDAAVPLYEQLVAIHENSERKYDEAEALVGLGRALSASGDNIKARSALLRALAIYDAGKRRPAVGRVQAELALVEARLASAAEALTAARAAVDIANSIDEPEARWLAHYALARAFEADGQNEAAADEYDQAVDVLAHTMDLGTRSGNREGWLAFGRVREVFGNAVTLLIKLKREERAFEILGLFRGLTLRRMFGPDQIEAQDEALRKRLKEVGETQRKLGEARERYKQERDKPPEQQTPEGLNALAQLVAQSSSQLVLLETLLKRDYPTYYDRFVIKRDSVRALRNQLAPGVVVVKYFTAPDALFILVISHDEAASGAWRVPVSEDKLRDAVFAFRTALKSDDPDAARWGAQLYAWLLQPIEADLEKDRTILIMPHGPLFYLPFQALGTVDNAGNVRYAIESHRIAYLSSDTVGKTLEQRVSSPLTLIAFANPDGSLAGAEEEVRTVKREVIPDARVLYTSEATKENYFKLARAYRVIHFATHGELDPNPTASYLQMANNEKLTVSEITGYELEGSTDLVVLSACDTAIQNGPARGDEMISIFSAFAAAGAPTLVATLWKVDDDVTRDLMTQFYRELRSGRASDKLEALRQAQLSILRMTRDGQRPYAAPRYWAAFELIGDYR